MLKTKYNKKFKSQNKISLSEGDIHLILNKKDVNKFVELAEKIAKECKNISTSKLRNIYDTIKRLPDEEKSIDKIKLIRPKLAYAAGREKKPVFNSLTKSLDILIKKIDDMNKLSNFKSFFEAIIAYHKFYGGKD